MKHDWVSGEIDIPKFHCPRCRDHWYGVSSFPCDEELARLIREGLWYTGNKPKGDVKKMKQNMFIPSETQTSSKDRKGSGHLSSSQRAKLPKLKHDMNSRKGRGAGMRGWEWNRGDNEEKTKRKKMITFQLEESFSEGSLDLDLNDSTLAGGRRSGSGENQLWNSGGGSGNDGSGDGRSGGGDGMWRGERGGGEGGGSQEVWRGLSGVDMMGPRHGMLQDSKTVGSPAGKEGTGGLGSEDNEGHLVHVQLSRGRHAGHLSQEDSRKRNMSDTLIKRTGLHRELGNGSSETDSADGYGSTRSKTQPDVPKQSSGSLQDNTSSSPRGQGREQTMGDTIGEDITSAMDASIHAQGSQNSIKSLRGRCNKTESSSEDESSGGESTTSSRPSDHGKKVRKPGGYMRAVSPSSSEWGDRLHARSFISSSIHSRSDSVSLASGKGEGNEVSASLDADSKTLLPPIVPRIIGPPPEDEFLGWRPNITRAWTFSYFNAT